MLGHIWKQQRILPRLRKGRSKGIKGYPTTTMVLHVWQCMLPRLRKDRLVSRELAEEPKKNTKRKQRYAWGEREKK